MERKYKKMERKYKNILENRLWRYTSPARKLVSTIRNVFRPETGKVGPIEGVESVAKRNKRNTSGLVTNKSRDFGQGATEQVADNSRNLGQYKTKMEKIKGLYALGFTERALKDLQNL